MNPGILTLVAAVLLLASPYRLAAVEEIKPPFKLHWGETVDRMERLLTGAKLRIVDRRRVDGREVWDVEGIVQEGLRRTVFSFKNGELVEVEFQYHKPEWPESKYDAFMGDVRRRLEQLYGRGELIARKTEPVGDVTQTLVGYKWNQNNTAVELFYFCAQNASQVFRTLSVHYQSN